MLGPYWTDRRPRSPPVARAGLESYAPGRGRRCARFRWHPRRCQRNLLSPRSFPVVVFMAGLSLLVNRSVRANELGASSDTVSQMYSDVRAWEPDPSSSVVTGARQVPEDRETGTRSRTGPRRVRPPRRMPEPVTAVSVPADGSAHVATVSPNSRRDRLCRRGHVARCRVESLGRFHRVGSSYEGAHARLRSLGENTSRVYL